MGEASLRTSYELAALLTEVSVLFSPRPPDDTMSHQSDHFDHNSTHFGVADKAAAAGAAAAVVLFI